MCLMIGERAWTTKKNTIKRSHKLSKTYKVQSNSKMRPQHRNGHNQVILWNLSFQTKYSTGNTTNLKLCLVSLYYALVRYLFSFLNLTVPYSTKIFPYFFLDLCSINKDSNLENGCMVMTDALFWKYIITQ